MVMFSRDNTPHQVARADIGRAFDLLMPTTSTATSMDGGVFDEEIAGAARSQLSRWMVDRAERDESLIIEAALVARGVDLVALIGPSGSGKTARTLVARDRGWTVLTDEACLVRSSTLSTIGARGQSRVPIDPGLRFGERWLFDTAPARTVSMNDLRAIVVLGQSVPVTTADRLRLLTSLAAAPASTPREVLRVLGEIVYVAPWFDADSFDDLTL